MGPDLTSGKAIVLKGLLFLLIGLLAAGMNLLDGRLSVRAASLLICIWAMCRFYYFLFYVLEKYVDPSLRYAGIFSLLKAIRRRKA